MSGVVRRPLYFGAPDQSSFGWFHLPGSSAGAIGAVICPPLGHEYTHSHRSLRYLADRLAGAGIPTLRFDYHGTGDAPGGDHDPQRLGAWIQSIRDAIQTLRTESGCRRVVVIGVRMGAALAVVASRGLHVDGLVLWAPCTRGRAYVREAKAVALTGSTSVDPASLSTDIETGGFIMTAETQADLGRLNLDDHVPDGAHVLIVSRDDVPDGGAVLQAKWAAQGADVELRSSTGYADMVLAPHNTRIPRATIAGIVSWAAALGDRSQLATGTKAGPPPRLRAPVEAPRQVCEMPGVVERCLRFGPNRQLFGVLSEPVEQGASEAPAVVLPNAGSTHHIGPGRLYVVLARTLSRAGFRCLRFDFSGLGDSVTDDPARENVPYPVDASAMVAAACDALAEQGLAHRFVVMGLCSGAHTAFHAAADLRTHPIAEAVLINPLTFYYTPGMPLDESQSAHVTQWQRYRRSMGSLRGWSKLFRPDTHLSTIVAEVFERIRIVSRNKVEALRARRDREGRGRTRLERDIRNVLDLGRRLTFVFSRFDPGYDLLMLGAGRLVKPLQQRGEIAIRRIHGANHTFDPPGPRLEMIEAVRALLSDRYLRPAAADGRLSNGQAGPAPSSVPWTAA
jgi:alpha-beta hydrolase superfamily lysophospholipase